MAVQKKEQDGMNPASHYLVVEDPEEPSTWHLRVRNAAGDLDHRLMGAAWAALTSPGGHRGRRYEGPNKTEAIAKLKKLYAGEDMDLPGEKAIVSVKAVGDWELDIRGVPFTGPHDKDHQGDYFTPETDLWLDKIPKRPIVYFHGVKDDDTRKSIVGEEMGVEVRPDGVWFRVLLDKASKYAQRIWEAAKKGAAGASTGALSHLVRRADDGRLIAWPIGELSLVDITPTQYPASPYAMAYPVMKALYEQAGLSLPDELNDGSNEAAAKGGGVSAQGPDASGTVASKTKAKGNRSTKKMADENVLLTDDQLAQVSQIVVEAIRTDREGRVAEEEAEAARQKEFDDAIAEAKEEAASEAKAQLMEALKTGNRLPFNGDDAPLIGKFGELRRYDDIEPGSQAVMISVLKASGKQVSPDAYKALNIKLHEDEGPVGFAGQRALKMAGMPDCRDATKADEVNYATLSSYGDEWVGVTYSTSLWEAIRVGTPVAARIPSIVVPQGSESITIPLESSDPTFYKVAEVTSDAASGGLSTPAPTVTSSLMGTNSTSLTVAKMGARTRFSGELSEDSLIPWANQLRAQLERAGAETMEHVIIDGDTATTASTNINDIAGTPDSTDAFLLFNGMRKLALVTNTANSRSGGALDENDYLSTVKLLGAAGKAAVDQTRVSFIPCPNTYWKTLENVTAIKTRDVWPNATLENGVLTRLWGYDIVRSYGFHWNSRSYTGYEYKANTAGKIDEDTTSNNTTGSLLAVRWDQWLLGFKRRMTIETERVPRADYTEIVALMRVGMVYRDTDACAITYNITV